MDLSYATIPVYGGKTMRLYRENQLAYLFSDQDNPTNHPVYVMQSDLDSFVLHMDEDHTMMALENPKLDQTHIEKGHESIWKMFFDGSHSKEGSGAGVVIISPNQTFPFSFKLEFLATNNVIEYEALILGLKAAKDMNIKHLEVFSDSELVVSQVKEKYRVKSIRLKQYKNEVCDLIQKNFSAFNLSFVPRDKNQMAGSLALAASGFKTTLIQQVKYEVQMKYMPSIPDNIKHWQVFEDDKEIE